jgi:spermidine/putrescine transport system substrate-binding protein
MLVPVEAANPAGAIQLMDYYYHPEVATPVTEFVLYLSPVPGTKEFILKDAKTAEEQNSKGYANKLLATAENPYMYPDDALLARSSYGRELKTDDERQEWDAIFLPISQG